MTHYYSFFGRSIIVSPCWMAKKSSILLSLSNSNVSSGYWKTSYQINNLSSSYDYTCSPTYLRRCIDQLVFVRIFSRIFEQSNNQIFQAAYFRSQRKSLLQNLPRLCILNIHRFLKYKTNHQLQNQVQNNGSKSLHFDLQIRLVFSVSGWTLTSLVSAAPYSNFKHS